MSDTTESSESIARRASRAARRGFRTLTVPTVAAICFVFGAVPAYAQQPGPLPVDQPPASPEFFPRYNFQLAANSLSGGDPRFTWDAHFGGNADIVDYVKGRVSVVADYEAVLGSEFRAFDPNQGIYILETSASAWAGQTEIAGVFHHVSRHISDRPKRYAIAWNILGARVLRKVDLGGLASVAVIVGGGKVVQHADVDYEWNTNADIVMRHAINRGVGVFAHGSGELFTVDTAIRGRTDTQYSGRFEGGVRFDGRGGALELFAGVEHRLDADPHDYLPLTWAIAGFRMVSK
jgi:hypothetical protein